MAEAAVGATLEEIPETEDSQKGKFLTFHLMNEDYGIEIRYVIEIIGVQRITEVPDMPSCIRGVINLRGKIIPVMDVRLRFGMPERVYDDRTCIVVVNVEGATLGLVVDQVSEVVDIPESQIEPPPASGGVGSCFILGMGKIEKEVKILLNVKEILGSSDLALEEL